MNSPIQLSLDDSSAVIILSILVGWYMLLSIIAFAVFGHDKRAARKQRTRVPEKRLHLLELLGGFPGAFLAIILFHHKSSKPSFLIISVFCSVVNVAFVAILLYSIIQSPLVASSP